MRKLKKNPREHQDVRIRLSYTYQAGREGKAREAESVMSQKQKAKYYRGKVIILTKQKHPIIQEL